MSSMAWRSPTASPVPHAPRRAATSMGLHAEPTTMSVYAEPSAALSHGGSSSGGGADARGSAGGAAAAARLSPDRKSVV